MKEVDLLRLVIPAGGLLFAGIVIGLVLISAFPQFNLILSSVYRALGRTAKWFRRKSIEAEIEGTMNSFSRSLNRDYSFDLLPSCEVQWVTAENHARILQPNKAIIKLSFSGEDHDLNIYNAAQAYVETGLLPDTKPYLARPTVAAIDLLIIRTLLAQSRRNALRIFNAKFAEQDDLAKAVYLRLEESDRESLFRQLLLPELHVFGHHVAHKTPTPEIRAETERFLDWFYEVATRPAGEFTKLSFESENVRVGVLLVADPETFDRFGMRPYLNRASLYASRDYQCIYILARGQRRADIAARIGRELVALGGYSPLNKRTVTTIYKGAEAYLITCIAIKPDRLLIAASAWQKLERDLNTGQRVTATIEHVTEEVVRVEVYGLSFDLSGAQLSSVPIGPAFRFFERDQELELDIISCDAANHLAEFSNRDTPTDPRNIVDLVNETTGQSVHARVEKIIRSRDVEIGWALSTKLRERHVKAFLPRWGGTFSRFISLEEKFPEGSEFQVVIEKFDLAQGRLTCRIENLVDPWNPPPSLRLGVKVTAVIREITENHATCEITEGVEARLFHEELSWDTAEANRAKMAELQVGQTIAAIVTRFDLERRHVSISVKRLSRSETEEFFDEHQEAATEVEVDQVGRFDAGLIFVGTKFRGTIGIRDVIWGYCERLSDYLHHGKRLQVKCLTYDAKWDVINVGIKQLEVNHFEQFKSKVGADSNVACEVLGLSGQSVRVRANSQVGQVFGYVHRSQVSWILFVDDRLAQMLFRIGDRYHCRVKRFDSENQLIEFSRKAYLKENHRNLGYGVVFKGRVVANRRQNCFYGDALEGQLVGNLPAHPNVTDVEVTISRTGNSPRDVEVSPV